MKTAVVTTTINVPTFLSAYIENAKHYGHENVEFIIVGDKKTPLGAEALCGVMERCVYMSPGVQDAFLEDFGLKEIQEHLPWNTIARRNVGHLLAYQRGADIIIMLDDDNLATGHDFVEHHSVVGRTRVLPTYYSSSKWFNVCDSLTEEEDIRFYARGYPPSQRWNDGYYTSQAKSAKVAVNAGLWINDPDIDAITRLERRLITTQYKPNWPSTFALHPGTWSPWNCQNTSISRAALRSYFLSPYTGRHLDIWASYITTRVAEHLGEVVTFGAPIAFHDRSPHNLYKDLREELPWIELTDEFCQALRDSRLLGSDYHTALKYIIIGLEDHWKTKNPVKQQYLQGLRAWDDAFERLR